VWIVFAILAAICFGVALLLQLVGVGTGALNLVTLGLLFVAVHLALGGPITLGRRTNT
jgi:hypothetical protein